MVVKFEADHLFQCIRLWIFAILPAQSPKGDLGESLSVNCLQSLDFGGAVEGSNVSSNDLYIHLLWVAIFWQQPIVFVAVDLFLTRLFPERRLQQRTWRPKRQLSFSREIIIDNVHIHISTAALFC